MAKRKVSICTGTACYVLGGADLLLLGDYLTEKIRSNVEITGSPCLGFCQADSSLKPPMVLIDDCVMGEASIQKIIEELEKN